ncbi:MAG: TetR/AcrR family transcriptional regulator [Bacteroidales bacterium]|nr:TetR/AcrR family transcriptional regulator [Bacteroidales bacterium]
MSPRTEIQFEEIRESRRKQIMDVALELFADNGYAHTSISQIATKAKISKGLMYNYFKSKDDLLLNIFDDGMRAMFDLFDPNKDGVITREEFVYFINESFNLMNHDWKFWKLYFSLMVQSTAWKKFEKNYKEIIAPLIQIMTNYYKKKGSENPEVEAMMVGALLDGIGFNFVFNPELYPLEEVKKMVINRFV